MDLWGFGDTGGVYVSTETHNASLDRYQANGEKGLLWSFCWPKTHTLIGRYRVFLTMKRFYLSRPSPLKVGTIYTVARTERSKHSR